METHSFFGFDGLTDLGLRSGVDIRPTLLRVLTDLYVQKLRHTPDEERHYTELALRLIEAVDMPTRIAVAARLARHLSPPMRVLQHLAGDLAEVAAPLRSHPSPQPPDPADDAPEHPLDIPVATGDAADEEYLLADAASVIDSATAIELNELFFAADAHERRLILLNLEIVAPLPAVRLDIARDPSVGQRLETAALAGSREDFAGQLVASLQISREQARRIVLDDLGEPVAAAAKALSVPRDMLYRILMFVNPAVGHSVERVHALASLYDEMTPPAAQGMVAIWRALERNERTGTKYQPVTQDETRSRARPATVAQRTATVPRRNERRSAS